MVPVNRPRVEGEREDEILDATLALLIEVGYDRLTMDAVAKRSRASKATLYRRWETKASLAIDALMRAKGAPQVELPDTGSLRGDLEAYLLDLDDRIQAFRPQDVLPHLVGAASYDPAVRSALTEYTRARQAPMRTVLTRAAARGDLPPGTDPDVFIDAVLGAINYRRLMTDATVDAAFVGALLDTVL